MTTDEKIQDIAVAKVRRSSREPEGWLTTVIGELHLQLFGRFSLEPGELVLVSAYLNPESWYIFTTRRVVSRFAGETRSIDPSRGFEARRGDFKGMGGKTRDVVTLSTPGGETLRYEYETGYPSMAPIYAERYWQLKHPILHKLSGAPVRRNRVAGTTKG